MEVYPTAGVCGVTHTNQVFLSGRPQSRPPHCLAKNSASREDVEQLIDFLGCQITIRNCEGSQGGNGALYEGQQ